MYASSDVFKSISKTEGLSDLVVNTIYKDKRGYMWFGTNSSIVRFDGIHLKNYPLLDSDKHPLRVFTVNEVETGRIICGTSLGIYNLDSISDKFVRVNTEVNTSVKSIVSFSADTLFVSTEKGLYLCKGSVSRQILFDDNIFSPLNNITGITISSDNTLWLSTMGGLVHFSPSDNYFDVYKYSDNDVVKRFYNISVLGDNVYLGTMDRGLMRFHINDKKFYDYIDVGCSVISSLSSDDKDKLYVGTDGNGVHFISVSENRIIKSYRHTVGEENGIRSNSVYSVLVDRDGLLWVGLYQLGVNYTLYQSGLFDLYKFKDFFSTKDIPVRTISFDGSRKLIGSRDGLIFIDEERGICKSYHLPVLRSNMIISSCYHKGKFYIGTYGGGMYVLDPYSLEIFDFVVPQKEPFQNGHIFCITPDYDGNLWVGTSKGVFCFKENKELYHFTSSHSKLPEGNVYEIYFDSSKKGWICTETGMCIWEPSSGSLKTDIFPEGFIHKDKIRKVYETSDRKLYFLPEKGSLFRSDISMNEFDYLDNIVVLDGKSLLSIIEDGKGGLFISTDYGLYRLDKDFNATPFNFTDGIPSPIFINCTSLKDSDDTFWFGNSKGLIYLKEGNINRLRSHPYHVSISNVLVDGKTVKSLLKRSSDYEYSLLLDEAKRNVTFQFSGLIYTDPANMVYEYCIDDSDEWIPLFGKSELTFYDVKDKHTKLKIRRMGYPDSQMLLYMNIDKSDMMWYILLSVLIILLFVLYRYRYSIIRLLVIRLKMALKWMVLKISTVDAQAEDDVEILPENTSSEGNRPSDESNIASSSDKEDDKYKTYNLSEEECKRLLKLLNKEMSKNKLYTNPNLKISDLAKVSCTTSYALSYLFNQYLHKSYYDYINEYRVEEFKNAVMNGKYHKYTLETLATHCGFSSRASFFRVFKKITNITPNEYIKKVENRV